MYPTPFPDLDAISMMRLPFYDMADIMTADDQAFGTALIEISNGHNSVKNCAIVQGVFCGLCLIGGAIGLYMLKQGADKKRSRNDLLAHHADDKED